MKEIYVRGNTYFLKISYGKIPNNIPLDDGQIRELAMMRSTAQLDPDTVKSILIKRGYDADVVNNIVDTLPIGYVLDISQ